jgi:hypothetical protein
MPERKKTKAKEAPPKPQCDPTTLGKRTVRTNEVGEVKVGETDLGKDIVSWRMVRSEREEISPMLTLEDAKALTECFGVQDWKPWVIDGQYACKFNDGTTQRRFIITQEILDVLNEG